MPRKRGESVAAKYDQWLTEEGLLRIQGWARDGLTQKDIAKNCRISEYTLRQWRDKFPEIAEALRVGKDAADRVVENALYRSACGYTVEITEPVKVKRTIYDEETGRKVREYEEVVEAKKEMHFPAQTTAQIFWLKNRKLKEWRSLDAKEQEARIDKLQAEVKALKAMLEPPENKQDDGFIAALADNNDWEDYKQEAADAEDKPDEADDGGSV